MVKRKSAVPARKSLTLSLFFVARGKSYFKINFSKQFIAISGTERMLLNRYIFIRRRSDIPAVYIFFLSLYFSVCSSLPLPFLKRNKRYPLAH